MTIALTSRGPTKRENSSYEVNELNENRDRWDIDSVEKASSKLWKK